MTSRTQGLVLALLAVVLVRIAVTGEYLRFVTPWMRWPILVSGVVLLAMAGRQVLGRSRPGEEHGVPASAWLLLVPIVVVFAVAPPPLGAYLAERRADQVTTLREPAVVPGRDGDGPLTLSVAEFAWGATQPGDPMAMAGRQISMSGFVSRGRDGSWYLTRLEVFCCAADAMVVRVRIVGQPSPPRDQWVRVTGTWDGGAAATGDRTATLRAERVVGIDPPRQTYG